MLVPKPVKSLGYAGFALLGFVAWKAGVLVPYTNDYHPNAFAARTVTGDPDHALFIGAVAAGGTLSNGSWDGTEIGGMIGPAFTTLGLSSPPDLTACIITTAARPACYSLERERQETSYCVNAFDCEWYVRTPVSASFAVVLLDLDTGFLEGAHDYIDAVLVLANDISTAQFQALDARTRLFISYVAPTHITLPDLGSDLGWSVQFDHQEKLRRERPFAYFSQDEIARGQILTQSEITIISPQN